MPVTPVTAGSQPGSRFSKERLFEGMVLESDRAGHLFSSFGLHACVHTGACALHVCTQSVKSILKHKFGYSQRMSMNITVCERILMCLNF